jgi:hypothetical protein
MDEVVETLVVAERAAEFVQANSAEKCDRERAAAVQEQAEAMLDAAEGATDRADRDGPDDRAWRPTAPQDRRLH